MASRKIRVGVIGAAGQLGGFILRCLNDNSAFVTALARRPDSSWPNEVQFRELSSSSPQGTLLNYTDGLDVVIIAAPVGEHLYREALRGGCNIVDVGVDTQRVRQLLALHSVANEKGLTILAMAGLAPGLMGRLAAFAREIEPDASHVDVCLIQSANGSSGFHGTCDMLDALTGPDSGQVKASIYDRDKHMLVRQTTIRFPTAETEIWPQIDSVNYVTLFDQASLNRKLRLLSELRKLPLGLYGLIRNGIARSKANTPQPMSETITLCAVCIGASGTPLFYKSITFSSDYGATAAIACAAARITTEGELAPGAKTLGETFSLESLLTAPEVIKTIVENSSNQMST